MKIFRKILILIVEIVAATALWCLLDCFFAEEINIAENVIGVTAVVLFTQIADCIVEKIKNKKDKK